jgi:hypothetical protein
MPYQPAHFCNLARQFTQSAIIGLAHIRETRPQFIQVRPDQGVEPGHPDEIQVVRYQHDIAWHKIRVNRSGRVGYDQNFNPQALHYTYRQCHLGHIVTFVKMNSPLHHQQILSVQATDHQTSGMPLNGG